MSIVRENLDEGLFGRTKKPRKWDEGDTYGFDIPDHILPIIDKDIKGKVVLEITVDSFFGKNTQRYLENQITTARIFFEAISSSEILHIEKEGKQTIFFVEVVVEDWYKLMRHLSDRSITDIKINNENKK